MKKWVRNLVIILAALAAAGIYYYIALPAVNIHAAGFWFFIITILLVIMIGYAIRTASREYVESEISEKFGIKFNTYGLKGNKVLKALGILLLLTVGI